MQASEQQAYTQAIMHLLQDQNPYKHDKHLAYIWATGFLAAYLASLSTEDPWTFKRFKQHVKDLNP